MRRAADDNALYGNAAPLKRVDSRGTAFHPYKEVRNVRAGRADEQTGLHGNSDFWSFFNSYLYKENAGANRAGVL